MDPLPWDSLSVGQELWTQRHVPQNWAALFPTPHCVPCPQAWVPSLLRVGGVRWHLGYFCSCHSAGHLGLGQQKSGIEFWASFLPLSGHMTLV